MASMVKVEHVNPFINATIETFKSMVNCEAIPGKVFLLKTGKVHFDVSGIIGLSGGARGTVALSFPRITALKVVTSFGGMKVLALDDIVTDAIGELANIVAGAAKKHLSQHKISISLPTVVVGENHEVAGSRDVIPMAVPFECSFGAFLLIVSFKSEV